MEKAESTLKTKLKQLERTEEKTDEVLKNGKRSAIERQLSNLKELLTEVDHARSALEALKIEAQISEGDITEWSNAISAKIEEADGHIENLEEWLALRKLEAEKQEREEKMQFEIKLHETKLKLQEDLQLKAETQTAQKPSVETSASTGEAKLPKLVITRFNGTYADWPRFWGQYSETIDKSNVPPVTKFAYLRELLDARVRKTVEALPHSAEGYNRATSILKDRFGKQSEIVKAYVKEILELPYSPTGNPRRIHEFYDKLSHSVQSLETLKSLHEVNGMVSLTLEKLPIIRGDLVRNDPEWETWDFVKFTEALRQWTRRNPTDNFKTEDSQPFRKRDRVLQTEQKRVRKCVYCQAEDHKPSECRKITSPTERKEFLARKKLCFNCTGPHKSSECKSTATCQHCGKRHHTSICVSPKEVKIERVLTAHQRDNKEVVYPIVLVEIDGVKTHALLDTGAGSSYASTKLINLLNKRPKETLTKRIDMMLGSSTTNLEIYSATLGAVDGTFDMNIELTKVHKPQLLTLDNPNYATLLSKYSHLEGVKIKDNDSRPQIPIHVVLGASEYATIKTSTAQRVGKPGQPVAEKTLLGWTLMSPGREDVGSPVLLTQSALVDYEQLCSLDVLGLADTHENDQLEVYEEFKEQLERSPAGWYETKLPWKANHPTLPTNEAGSKRRLEQLLRKLERNGQYEEYNSIIQEQIKEGVVEAAPEVATGKEFYVPHKGVTRENAESTKLRIVYDASARENDKQPSLNDCLNPGPPLQNRLWDILVRSRFYPVLLTGDLKKAFLQVRIKEEERDSLRFHWRPPNSSKTSVLRFTRALFGMTCSPFLLGGVINQHLDTWDNQHPELIKEIRDGLYVDDLMTGGETVEITAEKKVITTEVFKDASFTIHKWHSNAPKLEAINGSPCEEELTYAKQQLGGAKPSEGKLLGLPWDRDQDMISVILQITQTETTKRGVLSHLAKIYDPLGLASPVTLIGKQLYRDICDDKIPWDTQLPGPLLKRWKHWNSTLTENLTVPRTLAPYHQAISSLELHAFGDASAKGVSAAVYAVVHQDQGITQQLVCAKSRLAKKNLTIPRLELVAGHMAVNLVTNVQAALNLQPHEAHCWLDSTVALYWIKGQGEYRQFVSNRVHKIQQHAQVKWHHVPTEDNPTDLGSRGGDAVNSHLWKNGPDWLSEPSNWPPDIILEPTAEIMAEAKVKREILSIAIPKHDALDQVLSNHALTRALRIGTWVWRFIHNCRVQARNRMTGPISTEEIQHQELWWTNQAQQSAQQQPNFQADKLQLNLQYNSQQVLECRGRIMGEYPIYLPDDHPFTAKLVFNAHLSTLHGGVGLTMAKVREKYWVPRLRRLVKKLRGSCHGCKRFRARAYQAPPPGNLPKTRTEGSRPFQVIGVDFTGPIRYTPRAKTESKAYLAVYACSLTRAVHLDLLKSLETSEFIASLKRFIARRGRPEMIYSDNGSTFKATEKWLNKVQQDERFHELLASLTIKWQFNLSRAPWWGGQFERLIGLFKAAFYKTIGNGTLRWAELEEVVLDVEVALNNRPLSYLEEDIQLPVLTPNSMLHINSSHLPELQPYHLPEKDLRKRAKFLLKCKEVMWKRWTAEYTRSLRESHRRAGGKQTPHPHVGDVVIIQDDKKNRNQWKLAVVTHLIKGRDGIVRAAKLKTSKEILERAVQHLYPLELTCSQLSSTLNPAAPEFNVRPKRDAATAAAVRIQELSEQSEL